MSNFKGDSITKQKKVSDDQSYEYKKIGQYMEKKFFWYGQAWLDFAKLLAAKGFGQYVMCYFMGAQIDQIRKRVKMANVFGFEIWKTKYAPRLAEWEFEFSGKRGVVLPKASEKNDELSFHIHSNDAGEFWNEWAPMDSHDAA